MTVTQTDTATTVLTARSGGVVNALAVASLASVASTATPAAYYDSSVLENTSAEIWNEYEIQSQIGTDYTIENLSACQSVIDGVVTPVGLGGFGRVRITEGAISKILKCDTTKRGGQTYREFVEYSEGSISHYLYDQVEPLFDATPDVDYFSTYNHATATYTRNAACWAASVDLSCVVVASNDGSGWTRARGGTLIGNPEAPQHLLIARHYAYGVGTQVRIVNAAGVMQTKTVIGTSAAAVAGDLFVCTLNSPVTIAGACKIAGTWITQGRAVSNSYTRWYSGGVVIHADQNARIYAGGLGQTVAQVGAPSFPISIGGTTFSECEAWGFVDHFSSSAIPPAYAALMHSPVPGDSGQPSFVIIEGEPILLWTWTSPSGGTPAYLHNGSVLNALIVVSDTNAGISSGYTVTVAPDPTL